MRLCSVLTWSQSCIVHRTVVVLDLVVDLYNPTGTVIQALPSVTFS